VTNLVCDRVERLDSQSSKVCIKYLTMKSIIIIQPILFELNGDLASLLEQHISKEFDALVKITSPLNDNQLPPYLFEEVI